MVHLPEGCNWNGPGKPTRLLVYPPPLIPTPGIPTPWYTDYRPPGITPHKHKKCIMLATSVICNAALVSFVNAVDHVAGHLGEDKRVLIQEKIFLSWFIV